MAILACGVVGTCCLVNLAFRLAGALLAALALLRAVAGNNPANACQAGFAQNGGMPHRIGTPASHARRGCTRSHRM